MRLAVFTKNRTNPAYAAARLGAERAADAWNAEVEHFVPDTPDDPAEQRALLLKAIAQKPDALVLSPVHAAKIAPAVQMAAEQGIPIVGFVNPIEGAPSVTFVGADDIRLGRELAAYLFTYLGGTGTVLFVAGHEHSVTSRARLRGFGEAASAYSGIRIAGPLIGDYDMSVARQRASGWLAVNDRPNACFAANDMMALGVIEAMEKAGCRVATVGVNAIPQAIAAVEQGRMLATADFNAMQMAYLATECAIRHVLGESVPPHIELAARIVTASNCHDRMGSNEDRPVLTLNEFASTP